MIITVNLTSPTAVSYTHLDQDNAGSMQMTEDISNAIKDQDKSETTRKELLLGGDVGLVQLELCLLYTSRCV